MENLVLIASLCVWAPNEIVKLHGDVQERGLHSVMMWGVLRPQFPYEFRVVLPDKQEMLLRSPDMPRVSPDGRVVFNACRPTS